MPVPDGASWESFCRQVQAKLKLLGVDSVYLASVSRCTISSTCSHHCIFD